MPEKEAGDPLETTIDLKELGSKNVTVEILDLINLDVRALETEGEITTIIDNTDQPRRDKIAQDGLLIDEVTMDALEDYFSRAGVLFIGDPWVSEDQEDYLGSITISAADLNQALKNRKLTLSRQGQNNTYSFEGLDHFVREFVNTHFRDDKYNPEDD